MDQRRLMSFPLRLSPHIRQQATDLAHREGVSLNHFISLAIAEKLSRMEHDVWLAAQGHHADAHARPFADRRGGPVRTFGKAEAAQSRLQ